MIDLSPPLEILITLITGVLLTILTSLVALIAAVYKIRKSDAETEFLKTSTAKKIQDIANSATESEQEIHARLRELQTQFTEFRDACAAIAAGAEKLYDQVLRSGETPVYTPKRIRRKP